MVRRVNHVNQPDHSPDILSHSFKDQATQACLDSPYTIVWLENKFIKWAFCGVILAIAAIAAVYSVPVCVALFTYLNTGYSVSEDIISDIGIEGVVLFHQHDRDNDGELSLHEFEPLAHRLNEVKEIYSYDRPICDDEHIFSVEAFFDPLKLDTLSKDLSKPVGSGEIDPLKGLKEWITPVRAWQTFGTNDFYGFLPLDDSYFTNIGEVYYIVEPPAEMKRGPTLSSNRYLPPLLPEHLAGARMVHRLLSMFHQNTFVLSRFAPQGSVACIRAVSERYVEIMFRIHAEFQLNEPPFHPFWFTPGQFTGHVIMTRNASSVKYFHLYVPNQQKLNVDMEWMTTSSRDDNMEVDIGYMSRMEIKITSGSQLHLPTQKNLHETFIKKDDKLSEMLSKIDWSKEIELHQARRQLEKKLYPFKEVQYYNFTEAFQLAHSESKLVHSILLWGALDDQSC